MPEDDAREARDVPPHPRQQQVCKILLRDAHASVPQQEARRQEERAAGALVGKSSGCCLQRPVGSGRPLVRGSGTLANKPGRKSQRRDQLSVQMAEPGPRRRGFRVCAPGEWEDIGQKSASC